MNADWCYEIWMLCRFWICDFGWVILDGGSGICGAFSHLICSATGGTPISSQCGASDGTAVKLHGMAGSDDPILYILILRNSSHPLVPGFCVVKLVVVKSVL
jgi:hypothetical protein